MPSNHLILCPPLSSHTLNLSQHDELAIHIRWPKYWSFSISPSNEYSGLISFKIDGCDLLAVQGTLKSLLQNHSSKASILWHLAFFIVQFSHPYMTPITLAAQNSWVLQTLHLSDNLRSRILHC